jgi:D-alanyl-lipoteichoic acid acyltransferase DltB (MBOAT superfamily)
VRARDFIPQLYQPYALTRAGFGMGLFWILNGLVKKVWLADYLAVNLVDRVFSRPEAYSGFENLLGLYAYSLQVYADFSGYTDMAIGVAIWLGFRLPQNFNAPYKARNVGEFWKRWHMSLSTWLKDYLYIPMGGNRSGSLFTAITSGFILLFFALLVPNPGVLLVVAGVLCLTIGAALWFPRFKRWGITNINVMLTMLIGGLWHGASWNFVLWGGLNGLGIVVYKLWRKVSPWEGNDRWWKPVAGGLVTFHFITATRIWFRSGSKTTWETLGEGHNLLTEWFTANAMIAQLARIAESPFLEIIKGYAPLIGLMAIGYAIHLLPDAWKERYRKGFSEAPFAVQMLVAVLGISVAWGAMQAGMQPFIYFQF